MKDGRVQLHTLLMQMDSRTYTRSVLYRCACVPVCLRVRLHEYCSILHFYSLWLQLALPVHFNLLETWNMLHVACRLFLEYRHNLHLFDDSELHTRINLGFAVLSGCGTVAMFTFSLVSCYLSNWQHRTTKGRLQHECLCCYAKINQHCKPSWRFYNAHRAGFFFPLILNSNLLTITIITILVDMSYFSSIYSHV